MSVFEDKPKKVLMLLGNYDPATHKGIATASRQLNWHLNVSMLSPFQIPATWQGDGIICSLNNNLQLERFIVEANVPCVDLSAWRTDITLPRISGDNDSIGELAAKHFCENGHQNFAWFCHLQNPVADARQSSFEQNLKERGLGKPECLTGDATQDPAQIERWLKKLKKPSAIFAYNDNDAAWLLYACMSAGYKVPEDFSVIGVDNNTLICEHMPVPLSSINHDHERIGFEGAQLLDRIIKGETIIDKIQTIPPRGITLRKSSDYLVISNGTIKQALEYIHANLSSSIGTQDIADYLGISRRTLEQRFKKHLSTSVYKKIMEFRLKAAEDLLKSSELKLDDVATQCGFCHAAHLCRFFKRAYGLSPQGFRKQLL